MFIDYLKTMVLFYLLKIYIEKQIKVYISKHFLLVVLFQNEPFLLEQFLNITSSLSAIPTKVVTNFLINDLLTFCNKRGIELAQM